MNASAFLNDSIVKKTPRPPSSIKQAPGGKSRGLAGVSFFPPLSSASLSALVSQNATSEAPGHANEEPAGANFMSSRAKKARISQRNIVPHQHATQPAVGHTGAQLSNVFSKDGLNAGGFERLHLSIRRVVNRMKEPNLDKKWCRVSEYLDAYYHDEDADILNAACTTQLNTVLEETKHMAQPCEPITATCCSILDELLIHLCRLSPQLQSLCSLVRDKLIQSVFSGEVGVPNRLHKAAEQKPVNEAHMIEVTASKFMVGTYAQQARALQDKIVLDQQIGNMDDDTELAYWKNSYLRKVVIGWKTFIGYRKSLGAQVKAYEVQLSLEKKRVAELEERVVTNKQLTERLKTLESEVSKYKQDLEVARMDVKLYSAREERLVQEVSNESLSRAQMEERVSQLLGVREELAVLQQKTAQQNQEKFELEGLLQQAIVLLKGPSIPTDMKQLHQLREDTSHHIVTDLCKYARGSVTSQIIDNSMGMSMGGSRQLLGGVGSESTTSMKHQSTGWRYAQQHQERQSGNAVTTNTPYASVKGLLEWINLMFSSAPYLPNRTIDNDDHIMLPNRLCELNDSKKVLQMYLWLLHYVTGGTVISYTKLVNMITQMDKAAVADAILKGFNRMGLQPYITRQDLMESNNELLHLVQLIYMFEWFTNTTNFVRPNSPSNSVINRDQSLAERTASDWRRELQEATHIANEWKLANSVLVQDMVTIMIEKNKGNPVVITSPSDDITGRFLSVNEEKLHDLLPNDSFQVNETLQLINRVVLRHLHQLRRIFKYYGNGKETSEGALLLGQQEFWRLCVDARISDKKQLDRTAIRNVFFQVNRHLLNAPSREPSQDITSLALTTNNNNNVSTYGGTSAVPNSTSYTASESSATLNKLMQQQTSYHRPSSPSAHTTVSNSSGTTTVYPMRDIGGQSPQGTSNNKEYAIHTLDSITGTEWIEALIRLGNIKYKHMLDDLPEQFEYVIMKNLLPHCSVTEKDEFKEQVYKQQVQQILLFFKKYIHDVYKYYCHPKVDMSFSDFKRVFDDTSMFDESFNHYSLQHVFTKVQDSNDLSLTMHFHEFQIAIVAIAAFKHPSPYIPLHQRLHTFLDVTLLPRLVHKFSTWADWRM